MESDRFENVFTRDVLDRMFPEELADRFFESLLGDPSEGAFDIRLDYKGHTREGLRFHFLLSQRPHKCLACHLTAGLPEVFSRHPVINIQDLARRIERLLDGAAACVGWRLEPTQELAPHIHAIPLIIQLDSVPP
jgi:hypothetical protein